MKLTKPKNLDIWLYCLVFCCIFAFELWFLFKIISYVL